MQKIEIELKFPLLNLNELLEKLSKACGEAEEVYQKDTYFVPVHRDFLSAVPISEWLRIRETPNHFNLNYKNWHNKENSEAVSCDEFETGFEDVDALKEILKNLNFREIIVVEKKRRNWKINDAIISVDSVTNLGDFIEIEADREFESVDDAREHLHQVLREIGAEVGEQVFQGYPFLVLAKKELL